MHSTEEVIRQVRLMSCEHGTYHLCLGHLTLHLTARELLLLGQAVNRWVQKHPDILMALRDADEGELGRSIWIS